MIFACVCIHLTFGQIRGAWGRGNFSRLLGGCFTFKLSAGHAQVPLKDGDRIALLRERGAGMETLLERLGLSVLAGAHS